MTLHYHGTPITPLSVLHQLVGRHFCVSHARPEQDAYVHTLGQSVMLDNGAFSKWRKNTPTNWPAYYEWAERWLAYPTTWAVVPDEIDAGPAAQDAFLAQWPFGYRGAPVWHMDEPIDRLLQLCDAWPRVCIGSTSLYARVLSDRWQRRADDACNELAKRHRLFPYLHMLRGMACSGKRWPFASVDSTDVARNHNRNGRSPVDRAQRWDAVQCVREWQPYFDEI